MNCTAEQRSTGPITGCSTDIWPSNYQRGCPQLLSALCSPTLQRRGLILSDVLRRATEEHELNLANQFSAISSRNGGLGGSTSGIAVSGITT